MALEFTGQGGRLHGEAICMHTMCEPYALLVLSFCVQGTHKVVERMINMEDVQKAVKENRVSGVDWGTDAYTDLLTESLLLGRFRS